MMKDTYFSCKNCELSYCMEYINNNKICSGVIKSPNPKKPYDVIRLCIRTSNEDEIQTYDYTPDETSSIIIVLNHALGDWLTESKVYQKFRSKKSV